MRSVEVAGRKLAAAMRAGDIRAGQAHRIEGQALIVKAGRLETQADIGAKDRIASEVLVHRNAQRVPGVETRPADRAEMGPPILFGDEQLLTDRADGDFFRRRK